MLKSFRANVLKRTTLASFKEISTQLCLELGFENACSLSPRCKTITFHKLSGKVLFKSVSFMTGEDVFRFGQPTQHIKHAMVYLVEEQHPGTFIASYM